MKVNRVLSLVFGATTGVTLHEFVVGKGYKQLWKRDIPWVTVESVYLLWPMDWLENLLDEVKAMATPGTVIAPAMWGADVVHLNPSNETIVSPVLHYRSIPSEFAEDLIKESGIPKYEWSWLMGHVHPAFYQMALSSRFWRQCSRRPLYPLRVVPLADWMTLMLTRQKGHDQVMLHNQGAGVSTSKLINTWVNRAYQSDFAPIWPLFSPDELLEIGKDIWVVPCTHDSPLSRSVLASTGLPWGLWTGSWYGVFRQVASGDGITPNVNTFNAGLVSEAMPNNGSSAISNIGMHGLLYKALMKVNGAMSYEEAARLVLNQIPNVTAGYSDDQLAMDPEEFAKRTIKGTGNLGLALYAMVNTIAMKCQEGLMKAANALGVEMPSTVAITGGFAENPAILQALETHGIKAVVPPFAGLATQAGAAAEALRRAGLAKTTAEALKMFSEVELV